jgi:hypothetical protein
MPRSCRRIEGIGQDDPEELAKQVIRIGCVAEGGYVIGELIQQLPRRFPFHAVQKAEVADAFLKEENCSGARGLSGVWTKAELR